MRSGPRPRSAGRSRRRWALPDGGYNSPAEHRSPVAQLAEHPAVNRRVVGSSPTRGVRKGPQTRAFCFQKVSTLGRGFYQLSTKNDFAGDTKERCSNALPFLGSGLIALSSLSRMTRSPRPVLELPSA